MCVGSFVAGIGYSAVASATARNCLPIILVEIAPRSFQVQCINGPLDGAGGIPTWIVFSAGATSTENEARAARFQALVMATILAGRILRVDAVTDATLCSGIGDCQRANWWALWQ